MAEKRTADQLGSGDEFEPFEFQVTPELNQQYLFAMEDFHPMYIQETQAGPAIVHPGLLLNNSNVTKSPSYFLSPGVAGIHTSDEAQFINPGRIGKKFRVTWKVADVYEKRGRAYQLIETLVADEDGLEILRRRSPRTYASQEKRIEK